MLVFGVKAILLLDPLQFCFILFYRKKVYYREFLMKTGFQIHFFDQML